MPNTVRVCDVSEFGLRTVTVLFVAAAAAWPAVKASKTSMTLESAILLVELALLARCSKLQPVAKGGVIVARVEVAMHAPSHVHWNQRVGSCFEVGTTRLTSSDQLTMLWAGLAVAGWSQLRRWLHQTENVQVLTSYHVIISHAGKACPQHCCRSDW